ncbi:hypothetical protein HDU76_002790, partial [Blyttiomyces sp. JEL0837]
METIFRFPEFLLSDILTHIYYDRQTLSQARLVCRSWLMESTPILFGKISMTFEDMEGYLNLVKITSPSPPLSRYIKYIQVEGMPYGKHLEAAKTLYAQWGSNLKQVLESCTNLKGLFCDDGYLPGFDGLDDNDIYAGFWKNAESVTHDFGESILKTVVVDISFAASKTMPVNLISNLPLNVTKLALRVCSKNLSKLGQGIPLIVERYQPHNLQEFQLDIVR